MSQDGKALRALHDELAANARARIHLYLAATPEDDPGLRALEDRAVVLRAAIRDASPPPWWERADIRWL